MIPKAEANPGAPVAMWIVRWVFLRALGLIYLIAFVSFGLQVTGLIGAEGILPLGDYLPWIAQQLGARAYWLVPTVFWLNASDTALQLVAAFGALSSLCALVGFGGRALWLLLFVLYLSLVSGGQDFMAYQWDSLLLEAGFLAIFASVPSSLVVWLYRWLTFRLMFFSGADKLVSGDYTWRTLTALDYHFETQPLPTVVGWYMHQLPGFFHQVSAAVMFGIELGASALIFTTRRLRIVAAAALVSLQVLIFLTGNYAFFNLLAAALCLWLLDDMVLVRCLPRSLSAGITTFSVREKKRAIDRLLSAGCAAIVFSISGLQLLQIFSGYAAEPAASVLAWVAPLRIVNSYGLFAVMTTDRPEIVVEGSNDGQKWLEYGFAYKPGDVRRPPVWVQPHQPRLDWQLWFAALGYVSDKPWLSNRIGGVNTLDPFWLTSYHVDPWFVSFMLRLLRGSRPVLALVGKNPFPDAPPHYVRALLYRYHFSDVDSLNAHGVWWQRELLGTYLPAISLGAAH